MITQLANQGFQVTALCHTLGVSRSAYYAFTDGELSDRDRDEERLRPRVRQVFLEHKRRYGARRIAAELTAAGEPCGPGRVADIALAVDTGWLDRYEHRTDHPTDDVEKVTVQDGNVTCVHRDLDDARAHGEYVGVAKFTAAGAARLREHYHRCREKYAGTPFREAKVFEKAYLIHLFQEMIKQGERVGHADTSGEYIEIDTQQDFEYARRHWTESA